MIAVLTSSIVSSFQSRSLRCIRGSQIRSATQAYRRLPGHDTVRAISFISQPRERPHRQHHLSSVNIPIGTDTSAASDWKSHAVSIGASVAASGGDPVLVIPPLKLMRMCFYP